MADFPSSRYEILELNAENFNPKKSYFIIINTEDQYISGKFDCNGFSCDYKKDGQNIDFGFAISTKMYCEGDMENEGAFFGSIGKMKSFEYNGEILTFFDSNQKMILKLKRQES
jgi:heat shock protein HslJ